MKTAVLRQLETSVLGQSLNVFKEAGSTNDLAKERARAGGKEGEVFLALQQTAGRGRLGRTWESPAGKNILLSVILRPDCPPSEAPFLTLVAGAAALDLLASYLPDSKDLKIKWPNDVYWKDKKIAGVLTEAESERGALRFVICGIGVNLNSDAGDFSPDVGGIAASLKSVLGRSVDLAEAAARLLNFLERRYQDFLKGGREALIAFYDAHSYLKGREIFFETPEGKLAGVARGLTPQGHLLVERQDRSAVAVVSGDVTLARVL